MGKKSGMSWLTLVKKAFRSPTKEHEKKCSRRREPEHDQQEEEDEEKKREKRRWLFRKNNNNHVQVQQCEASSTIPVNVVLGTEQRHAIELAAAAAEAAAVTAKAAADIVRFTRPPSLFVREHWAAIVIQTAFRGYLARRALRALKGLVKLQALVRGHNVRKQAKLTLKCMQALVRVQDRIRDQRAWLSIEGSRKSMFAESNGLWESRYFQDIRERRSMSRDVSSTIDDWDDRPQKSEEVDAMVQRRKQAALRREKALAYAFSSQIWRSRRNPSEGDEKELDERTRWLDRWMVTKQWESGSRASTDRRDTMMKTIEIDTSRTPQISSTPSARRSQHQNHHQNQPTPPSVASPLHRAHNNFCLHQSPMTPSPGKTKPLQVRSASPRLQKEEKCYSAAHTPSLSSRYSTNSGTGRYGSAGGGAANNDTTILPNYMAATESAKARIRPQSAPRQRPSTPERDRDRGGAAKKRLSYPAPEPLGGIGIGIGVGCSSGFGQNLRSPSFKSCHCGHFGIEQPPNFPSFYTESIGGEISPCSTTDLRWLK